MKFILCTLPVYPQEIPPDVMEAAWYAMAHGAWCGVEPYRPVIPAQVVVCNPDEGSKALLTSAGFEMQDVIYYQEPLRSALDGWKWVWRGE